MEINAVQCGRDHIYLTLLPPTHTKVNRRCPNAHNDSSVNASEGELILGQSRWTQEGLLVSGGLCCKGSVP